MLGASRGDEVGSRASDVCLLPAQVGVCPGPPAGRAETVPATSLSPLGNLAHSRHLVHSGGMELMRKDRSCLRDKRRGRKMTDKKVVYQSLLFFIVSEYVIR